MRVLKKLTLREYAIRHLDVAEEIWKLYASLKAANWTTAAEVKADQPNARYVGGNRWIFPMLHNRYRLIAQVVFATNPAYAGQVFIRFIGTHAEYDRIADVTII